ncbi:MAG TPA: CoA-binding protein [Flavobacteriaceae bacterium]|jgi:predicted CoA-binding protein|nr:CoA-binding protein [Flavobacteriaceae bacterium]
MVKKTLVLGVSLNPDRYSNMAVKRLTSNQVEVVAIGSKCGRIGKVLIEKDSFLYKDIHTVTLYLNKNRQSDYYDFIISLKPKRVIFNPGTENSEFYKLLKKESISYMEACTLVLLSTNQY